MIKTWINWINIGVASVAALFLLLGFVFLLTRPGEIPVSEQPPPKTALPKRAFAMPQEAYDAIGEPVLSLQFAPMSMQLPDLKRFLVYYGKNGRPDAELEKPLLHFSFAGNKALSSVTPGEPLYILYDRSLTPPQYIFSPKNEPTSLWIEATPQGSEAVVNVTMKGENGEIIREPEAYAVLRLGEKEYSRFGAPPWEIGTFRADATLLSRMKARWYGSDLFLERHGGKEYSDQAGKQRIDFGEGDEVYSVYVGLNDSLVWENNRWNVVKPGPESLGKPLLLVKKVDDRIMTMELWDPEGKGKINLNLIKSSEPSSPVNIAQQFKFVGARTRTQFIFEINKERVLLSPHDWLLLTKQGWMKLVTPQEIDDYVDRRLTGPLFVFDEVERREDKQILKGALFNAARTDMQVIEIPLQQTGGAVAPGGAAGGPEKNEAAPPGPREMPIRPNPAVVPNGSRRAEIPKEIKDQVESDEQQ